jgi:ATP-dependent Clp protease ATP-binding subunit ClpA
VDCSKAIWILATNAFDDTIHQFCKDNEAALFHSDGPSAAEKLVRGLCKTLRTKSISTFGAPLTGRITEFVPFLTFSQIEQTAVAHKYLAEVGRELASPVVVTREEGKQRFVGDIELQVPKDYSVCRIIAQDEYVEQLGARSVINGVNRMIEGEVIDHYLEMDDEIREGQAITTYRVQPNMDDDIEVCYVPGGAPHGGGTE